MWSGFRVAGWGEWQDLTSSLNGTSNALVQGLFLAGIWDVCRRLDVVMQMQIVGFRYLPGPSCICVDLECLVRRELWIGRRLLHSVGHRGLLCVRRSFCLAKNYGTSTDGLSRATESKPKTARKCFDYTNTGCADEDVGCFQWCVCPSNSPGGD